MLEPFLKWAGGKRWLVESYAGYLPKRFNRYIEPFLGSAAVFFYLAPHRATLADSNRDLVETYRALKKAPRRIHNRLKLFQERHGREFYYSIRTSNPAGLNLMNVRSASSISTARVLMGCIGSIGKGSLMFLWVLKHLWLFVEVSG